MAMTVPKTCRNTKDDKRNERKPITSVKMAMASATEVMMAP